MGPDGDEVDWGAAPMMRHVLVDAQATPLNERAANPFGAAIELVAHAVPEPFRISPLLCRPDNWVE